MNQEPAVCDCPKRIPLTDETHREFVEQLARARAELPAVAHYIEHLQRDLELAERQMGAEARRFLRQARRERR